MDVSVIVPVYNVEQYLARCLDSLLGQTTDVSYEILCIDDASPDGSSQILAQYTSSHSETIRVIRNEENLGLGESRDRGVVHARGELVMFIDSDDYVEPDYIQTYVQAFRERPCDIVIGGYIETSSEKERQRLLPHSEWTPLCFSAAWAKLFRRRYLVDNQLKYGSFRYAEDTYFSLRSLALDPSYHIIDYAGYHYCLNPTSITREKAFDKNLERTLSALYDAFMTEVNFDSLPLKKQHMVEYSYIADMLSTILLFNKGCGRDRMSDKTDFFLSDLQKRFPDYRKNPYMGFFKPRGQRLKTRIGVGTFKWADRIGLSRKLFSLFS